MKKIIRISEVKTLLEAGHKVSVKTKNNEYTNIVRYIEKGFLESYYVELDNKYNIKVSHEHKFFTNAGWILTKDLLQDKHTILCDDNKYHKITILKRIGKQNIVDITVSHKDSCYFGNGMLNHNSGKSLLCAYAIKSTQEMGGVGVYIDTEDAEHAPFLKTIGVDIDKMVYVRLNILEDIYQIIEDILLKIKEEGDKKPVTIIFDSQSGAIAKNEDDSNFEKQGWNTDKAIINSMAMRKITSLIADLDATLIITQQLRTKLGCVNPDTTSITAKLNDNVLENITINNLFERLGYNYENMEINIPYDVTNMNYQILTENGLYNNIKNIVRKNNSVKYIVSYNNKNLECSGEHKLLCKQYTEKSTFIEVKDLYNSKNKYLIKEFDEWVEFTIDKTNDIISIVDFELDNEHTYLSNDIVSHNTSFGDPYCVDPNTTEIQIRYKNDLIRKKASNTFIYETITMKEFSDRFANNDDFINSEIFDINPMFDVQVLGYDFKKEKEVYKPILTFVIKDEVNSYYTDGKLLGSSNHKIYKGNETIKLSEHTDFKLVKNKLSIVDIEVKDIHNYYANGRLNHNTTSGGFAIGFHSSVRIRLKKAGQIKGKVNGVEQVIGIETLAQITKSRLGPNLRKVYFKIYYDSGINDYENWLDELKRYDLIKTGGAWYTYISDKEDSNGMPVEYKFMKKYFEAMLVKQHSTHEYHDKFIPGLKEEIYNKLCDVLTVAYKPKNLNEEDIVIDRIGHELNNEEINTVKLSETDSE